MLAETATRARDHTSEAVNDAIDRDDDERINYYRHNRAKIADRLRELDREWDIERVLETGSSTLTLSGLLLSVGVSRKWLILSIGVQAFFLQHALQGWCPPLPVFRRLGFRTANEINRERQALLDLDRESQG